MDSFFFCDFAARFVCIPTVISPQKSGTHRGWQDVWFLFSVRTVVTCRLSNCTTYLALALEKTIQRIVRLGLPIPMLCLPSCSRRASCCGLNACLSRTRVQTTLSGRRLWTLSSLVWREGAEEKNKMYPSLSRRATCMDFLDVLVVLV